MIETSFRIVPEIMIKLWKPQRLWLLSFSYGTSQMTIDILSDLIPIPCTDRDKINQLRSLLVQIQSAWFDNLFDSGLTFSTPEIFEKMQSAICLLERRDNPSVKGIDLKAIASDYALLEKIFIAAEWATEEYSQLSFDSSTMKGCDLVALHRFSAVGILKEVDAYRNSKNDPEENFVTQLLNKAND